MVQLLEWKWLLELTKIPCCLNLDENTKCHHGKQQICCYDIVPAECFHNKSPDDYFSSAKDWEFRPGGYEKYVKLRKQYANMRYDSQFIR